jgi:signal transduction histidine kinase
VLIFEDNGLGIDLEKNGKHLFAMFKTFHESEDSRGLGLYITKNQIESMGGNVEVESEPYVGTTFKVYLPKSKTD